MTAYYNEIEPFAADWLENLIAAGHIAPGVVDRRSIEDVTADDLRGFTQCHFFAGIGVWSHSLRLAGWPDDRPVWTGSCPCQPFSAAGKGGGVDDKRHLWPAFLWLIRQRRPTEVLGEQVASKDGLGWADLVQSDLEGEDYACGFVDTGSAGHRAPHIRQRLRFAAYDLRSSAGWVADAPMCGREPRQGDGGVRAADNGKSPAAVQSGVEGSSQRLANADDAGSQGLRGDGDRGGEPGRNHTIEVGQGGAGGLSGGVADANGWDACAEREQRSGQHGLQPQDGGLGGVEQPHSVGRERWEAPAPGHIHDGATPQRSEGEHGAGVAGPYRVSEHGTGPLDGFWRDADWLLCRDGKWRPTIPSYVSIFDGTPHSVVSNGASHPHQEREIDGPASEADTLQGVQTLSEEDGAQGVQRQDGRTTVVQSQGLLRSSVHGESDGETSLHQRGPQQGESVTGCEDGVRNLRKGGKASRPPQRREPFQQYPVELDDIVSALPRSLALAKLDGRRRDAEALHLLCEAICKIKAVLYSPEQTTAIWSSLSQEEKDRVGMGVDVRKWRRVVFHPLSVGEPSRVGRLRAYGNAVDAQATRAFVTAYLEVTERPSAA